MKIQLIDFISFFNEKNKLLNNGLGIGAVSIITNNQMVTRLNEEDIDNNSNKIIKGLGRHEQEKGLILSDIFNFYNGLYQNREGHNRALQSMSEPEKKVLDEVVEIRYSNSNSGNIITINIPKNGISNNMYQALEYLLANLEKLNLNVNIWLGNKEESIAIENNYLEKATIYLKTKINNNFIQSVEDKNIIANYLLEKNTKFK